MGPDWRVAMSPRRNGESVSWRTSQDWLTVCIQLPTWATILPA